MANIKANIKNIRKTETRKLRNKSEISSCKSCVKKAKNTANQNDISAANKKVDSLCAKGKIHKNKASRIKSRVAKNANKLNQSKKTTEKK